MGRRGRAAFQRRTISGHYERVCPLADPEFLGPPKLHLPVHLGVHPPELVPSWLKPSLEGGVPPETLRAVYEVNRGLVYGHGVRRGEQPYIRHYGGVGVAVAVALRAHLGYEVYVSAHACLALEGPLCVLRHLLLEYRGPLVPLDVYDALGAGPYAVAAAYARFLPYHGHPPHVYGVYRAHEHAFAPPPVPPAVSPGGALCVGGGTSPARPAPPTRGFSGPVWDPGGVHGVRRMR